MGVCGSTSLSPEQIDAYNKTRIERDELKKEKVALEEELRAADEQGTLLRFKVEVLIQMLAVEEKKTQTAQKRLEASKFCTLSIFSLNWNLGLCEERFATSSTKEQSCSNSKELPNI